MNSKLYLNNWRSTEIADAQQIAGPVLIIGASGFIGANLFFGLSRHRSDVIGCSRNIHQSWRLRDNPYTNLENIDITDRGELNKLVRKIMPKTVFNLSSYDGQSQQTDIERIHLINYLGTLNILRILQDVDCQAFVQAGTSSEYGLNSAAPAEKDELIPNSDYAVSKIGASYLVKYYGKFLGFPVMHLRPYSIYGPWDRRQRFIPMLATKGLEKQWPPFSDEQISHDFVYVDDCLNAFIKAALCLCARKGIGEVINVATGIKTTMGDLAKIAKKIFEITEEPKFGTVPNKKWDLADWYGNPALAGQLLNWNYRTSLENGLKLTAEWEKEFKKTA